MTQQLTAAISARILALVSTGVDPLAAMKSVCGSVAVEAMVSSLYDELRNRPERVTIGRINYNIVSVNTADSLRTKGYPRSAELLEEYGAARELVLQRPNGKRQFFTREYRKLGAVCYSNLVRL